jgi:hypothetical protein
LQFILGEKREVTIHITSTDNQPFTIRNPTFNLIKRGSGTIEGSGLCKVYEKEISALVQPKTDGSFVLEFSYEIANEILKAVVPIEVRHYAST